MASSEAPGAPLAPEDFQDLFENAPCGYLLLGSDGRIVAANATLADWIGREKAGLVGSHLRDLLPIASRIFYEVSFAPLLRLQQGFGEVAMELSTSAGEKLPVLASAKTRADPQGAAVSVRVVMVRAKQRLGYERELLSREAFAAQALLDEQAASTLREQFIAVLGHDLRNPLASVSSGVRLLQRDPSKEKADQIAGMMRASVLRMTDMIENVLDFARGRLGGGISLRRAPTDLEATILHVVDELRAAYPERSIDVQSALPALVSCDGPRMAQLLSNLVGNACVHGDPATPVTVDAFAMEQALELSVINHGFPISEAKMRTLFKPFSRQPGSAPAPGLGLGLFIASEIAIAHGGTLTADSSTIETRFTFRMPLALA